MDASHSGGGGGAGFLLAEDAPRVLALWARGGVACGLQTPEVGSAGIGEIAGKPGKCRCLLPFS